MSWTLGGTTLPDPKGIYRERKKIQTAHQTLVGTLKKDKTALKNIYYLTYEHLPQSTVSSLLSLADADETAAFAVTETNYTIPSVDVHVTIPNRNYNMKGGEFREDFVLILEEV